MNDEEQGPWSNNAVDKGDPTLVSSKLIIQSVNRKGANLQDIQIHIKCYFIPQTPGPEFPGKETGNHCA